MNSALACVQTRTSRSEIIYSIHDIFPLPDLIPGAHFFSTMFSTFSFARPVSVR